MFTIESNYLNSRHVKQGDCWIWQAGITKKGRPKCSSNYFKKYGVTFAYQLSYLVHKGDYDKNSLQISHLCHNKLCINPDHLVAESYIQNRMRDITRQNSNMYLDASLEKIYKAVKLGESNSTLCKKFNITRYRLKNILNMPEYLALAGEKDSLYKPTPPKKRWLFRG